MRPLRRNVAVSGVVRMHKCEMGVPRRVRLGTESKRMVARETEVVRAACIDEGEPAGGIRVPGVGRNLIERGLQLRGVNHERQIYRARQLLGNCQRVGSARETKSLPLLINTSPLL